MELSKELEKEINDNVPFETKEKIFEETKTKEGFRQWRLKRMQQVTGIEFEDVEIDGAKYIVIKNK